MFVGRSASSQGLCLLHRLPADTCTRLCHHRHVVIGAERQADAPEAHRALEIELGGAGEGAGGIIMVEGPEEAHALVEIGLGGR